MKIQPRKAWGAKPPDSVTRRDPKTLKGVAAHWFGGPKAAKNHADCPAQLRQVQAAHMAGEYADFAYGHAVCQHGTVYEGRGFGVQAGANGTTKANEEYAAVVYMADAGDPLTDKAKEALAWIIGEWRKRGAGKDVKPHHAFKGTECPGPQFTAWIKNGLPLPKPPMVRYRWRGPKGMAVGKPSAAVRKGDTKAERALLARFLTRPVNLTPVLGRLLATGQAVLHREDAP